MSGNLLWPRVRPGIRAGGFPKRVALLTSGVMRARRIRPSLATAIALALATTCRFTSALPTESPPTRDALAAEFADPPGASRPWVYWWWVAGNVDEPTITRDLEAMRQMGIAGFLMFDARGYHEGYVPPPPSRMDFMGPEWRRLLGFAMREAARLGLEMSVNLSSCAGALRGPWDVGDDAPKKLVWASAELDGPSSFRGPAPAIAEPRARDIATVAVRSSARGARVAEEVVDLAPRVDASGDIAWDVPSGHWTLLRFACATMADHTNDVDILSADAVRRYFDRMGGALIADAGPLVGKTLTRLYSVSWEGAIPTWTPGFERQFERSRGYDLRPLLPAIAGFTVRSPEVTSRFLRDYHRALADCFMENCYGTLRALCHRHGLQWHSESGGPWDRKLPTFEHADQYAFLARNDMPQGEFWFRGRAMNRPAAMAAHVYGLPLAATEAFTHMRQHWSAYPAALKPDADGAFCEGSNFFIWHTFTCSPPEFGRPGIEYFAGTHLNPNVTWWPSAGDFLKYLARCQHMLRQGKFVADICCYRGDRPYLHWGRWPSWAEKPEPAPGPGWAYDLINTEALLGRLSVKDGQLALPDGMRYRLLAVDLEEHEAPAAALRKILDLANEGATVVLGRRRPTASPGLRDYPACDDEVRRLADELWGDPGATASSRPVGKGRVLVAPSIGSFLGADDPIGRDFDGPFTFIHRASDDADLYFLAGSGSADCTFRVRGRRPEFWDPVTGRITPAAAYRPSASGATVVPIRLPENGSIFVVFRHPADPGDLASFTGLPAEDSDILGRTGAGARARFWQNGACAAERRDGKRAAIDISGLPEPIPLAGPWEVRFAPGWGAPETATFDRLAPWDESPDEGIRHFSGSATYRISFQVDPRIAAGPSRLRLGEVRHIARIRANGNDLGIVWTAPWIADLTGKLRGGSNDIEIEVTNLWVNRLIGDAALPPERRLTKTNVPLHLSAEKLRPHCGFTSRDPLERSGLLGPVRIEFGGDREIRF